MMLECERLSIEERGKFLKKLWCCVTVMRMIMVVVGVAVAVVVLIIMDNISESSILSR